jgi:hypothetical protein
VHDTNEEVLANRETKRALVAEMSFIILCATKDYYARDSMLNCRIKMTRDSSKMTSIVFFITRGKHKVTSPLDRTIRGFRGENGGHFVHDTIGFLVTVRDS